MTGVEFQDKLTHAYCILLLVEIVTAIMDADNGTLSRFAGYNGRRLDGAEFAFIS